MRTQEERPGLDSPTVPAWASLLQQRALTRALMLPRLTELCKSLSFKADIYPLPKPLLGLQDRREPEKGVSDNLHPLRR